MPRSQAGATFSGAGAVIVPQNSHLVPDANANINTLLDNEGTIRPAGFDVVGRVDLKDYQQTSTGSLFVELTGTLLNQFDRFVVNGAAVLDGYLNIDIDGSFVPTLGQTFNIITATSVTGTFNHSTSQASRPASPSTSTTFPTPCSSKWSTRCFTPPTSTTTATSTQTDYLIWHGAFNLNQLGDANGDNRIRRRRLHALARPIRRSFRRRRRRTRRLIHPRTHLGFAILAGHCPARLGRLPPPQQYLVTIKPRPPVADGMSATGSASALLKFGWHRHSSASAVSHSTDEVGRMSVSAPRQKAISYSIPRGW